MSKPKTAVLNVRVTLDEGSLLKAAAERSKTTLSNFIRGKALEAAEIEIMDRRITIPAADWPKFETWVNEPGKEIPALQKLARLRPAWQE